MMIKTLFKISMSVISASVMFSTVSAQTLLNSNKNFLNEIRNNLNSSQARTSKPSVNLKLNDRKSFTGLVNFKQSDTNSIYINGEINGKSGSSFYLNIKADKVEGHIILKTEKLAYQYTSDGQNTYINNVDINKLICIDMENKPTSSKSARLEATNATAALSLQSLPGANGCVFLDVDGYYMAAGNLWNNGNAINAASSGMNDAAVQEMWEVVSEDYRPFNVNITTSEAVFNSYPKNRRMRCVVTPTNTAAPGAGGVAYIGSFNWDNDVPCWVFITSGKAGGEAVSHEIGHTLGLGHDGRTSPSEEYYAGQGDWSPIMGVGYYKNITQWSKGEYNNAKNKEDDLSIMTDAKYGLGFRNDDYSNATSGASVLNVSGSSVSKNGIIERTSDVDYFSFNTGGGNVSINVNTVSRHGDLDILLKLYNSSGSLIGTYNPAGLNASFSANLSAGLYYISIDGSGAGNPATDGYSDYASLGSYFITGTVPPAQNGVATFYKDCSYGGYAVSLPAGSYTLSQLNAKGILNDDISSIKMNAGFEVVLYNDDNFAGSSIIYKSNDDCLVNENWNDLASSLVIRTTTSTFTTTIQAENYSNMLGVQTESTTDAGGGQNVGYIDNGDWMAYNSINFPTSGSYKIEYRVASVSGGILSADLNAGSIVLGQVSVPATGAWQNWTTVSHTVNINAGSFNFGIFAQQGGWNINWIKISKVNNARLSDESTVNSEINVYPNPADNIIYVNTIADKIELFDLNGSKISENQNMNHLDVSGLNSGIYLLKVSTSTETKIFRIVKN